MSPPLSLPQDPVRGPFLFPQIYAGETYDKRSSPLPARVAYSTKNPGTCCNGHALLHGLLSANCSWDSAGFLFQSGTFPLLSLAAIFRRGHVQFCKLIISRFLRWFLFINAF
ncbi:hypothetical protein Zmor_012823 [Zophobas morio]|uniref:Uncharacterized protein n=1 Tax=Zophobas morio TaxID=2755281 RepID=A0AA38IC10_9CUCU|nr:hypothetical protein Zmor_012823 [Zophobas morio]